MFPEDERHSGSPCGSVAFVIGAGRSGTTLVYRCLCAHPDVAWISNYLARFPGILAYAALNRFARAFPRTARDLWFDRKGNAFPALRNRLLRLFPSPAEGESVYARCGIPVFPEPAWCMDHAQSRCLGEYFRIVMQLQGARVFISKRTANNRRIPQLIRTFPEARFIHVLRDGRAVANSLLKASWWEKHRLWWCNGWKPSDCVRDGVKPLEIAARNWVEEMREIEAGVRAIPADQLMEVKYEELIRDGASTWDQMVEFLGLSPSPAWLAGVKSIPLYDGNKWWLEKSSSEEKQLMLRIQVETLRRFGYEGRT